MNARSCVFAVALAGGLVAPALAEGPGAKNIILLISDGAGFNGWLTADYYQGLVGQQSYQIARPDGTVPVVMGLAHYALNLVDENGNVLRSGSDPANAAGAVSQGYDPIRRWDRFEGAFGNDYSPVSRSYTSYTDSAAAGTALLAGRRTANGRLNMDWTGKVPFRTIAEIAMEHGKAAGAVSSVQVSHATPAAVAAHNISRNNYAAIFNEMVGSGLTVIMGGGHPLYDHSGNSVKPQSDKAYRYVGGPRTWAKLTGPGLHGYTFIDDRRDFEALASGRNLPERVVGVARVEETLQAKRDGKGGGDTPSGMAFNGDVPSLATMTVGALNVLAQDEDGFFLMAEGGAVDWMGHANHMPRYIEEQIDFNLAVDAAIEWVETNSNWDETLLIVTSDHECGGIWGEGSYTNSVGGPVAASRSGEAIRSARFDPSEDRFNGFLTVQDNGTGAMPGYQFASGNHTNDLVPLWVLGAGAETFSEFGSTDLKAAELWGDVYGWDGAFVENTVVFHVMLEALVGDAVGPSAR